MLALGGCLGWPQAGFGPGKTSYAPGETAVTPANVAGLREVWSTDVPATVQAVAAAGRVHVLTDSFVGGPGVTTLDLASGAVRWRASFADPVVGQAAYVDVVGGAVRAVASDVRPCGLGNPQQCQFYYLTTMWAFDPADGTPAQTDVTLDFGPPADTGTPGEAAVGAGVAAVPFRYGELRLVPLDGGAARSLADFGAGAPALDETAGRVIAPSANGLSAWSTDCPPGTACDTPLWTVGEGPFGPPALEGSRLYAVDRGTRDLRVLDPATGAPAWTGDGGYGLSGEVERPAVRDGVAYVGGATGDLLTVFAPCGRPTCAPAWFSLESTDYDAVNGGAALPPVVAGSLVYVAHPVGERHETDVSIYDAGGCGRPGCPALATLHVTGDPLDVIVAGGRVVVRTTSGLHAYGVPAPE
jgi:hypothetical protein